MVFSFVQPNKIPAFRNSESIENSRMNWQFAPIGMEPLQRRKAGVCVSPDLFGVAIHSRSIGAVPRQLERAAQF